MASPEHISSNPYCRGWKSTPNAGKYQISPQRCNHRLPSSSYWTPNQITSRTKTSRYSEPIYLRRLLNFRRAILYADFLLLGRMPFTGGYLKFLNLSSNLFTPRTIIMALSASGYLSAPARIDRKVDSCNSSRESSPLTHLL